MLTGALSSDEGDVLSAVAAGLLVLLRHMSVVDYDTPLHTHPQQEIFSVVLAHTGTGLLAGLTT